MGMEAKLEEWRQSYGNGDKVMGMDAKLWDRGKAMGMETKLLSKQANLREMQINYWKRKQISGMQAKLLGMQVKLLGTQTKLERKLWKC